jgi:hypothetical protein
VGTLGICQISGSAKGRILNIPKRECALAAAERFEAFAIEEKLKGSPHIGMVATKVIEHDGHWAVKPDYLSTSKGNKWRTIASDLGGEEED